MSMTSPSAAAAYRITRKNFGSSYSIRACRTPTAWLFRPRQRAVDRGPNDSAQPAPRSGGLTYLLADWWV